MNSKIYVFNILERDNAEYTKHLALATMKQPALDEVVKFIFDGCHGHNPEISEKTIDDAFDCIINCEKTTLYAQGLPEDEHFIITPKEIDELITNMSNVVARGINLSV